MQNGQSTLFLLLQTVILIDFLEQITEKYNVEQIFNRIFIMLFVNQAQGQNNQQLREFHTSYADRSKSIENCGLDRFTGFYCYNKKPE